MAMNNKNSVKAVVFTALLSLIVCLCFVSFTGCFEDTEEGKGTESSSIDNVTVAPVVTTPGSSEVTTVESSTPEVTTTPTPTESQTTPSTPEVTTTDKTPETTVLPAPLATHGTFKMDTGSSLEYRIDWKLDKFDDEYAYIDLSVVLDTYEIYVSPRKNLGIINFGEESIRFSTDRISYSGKKKAEIILTVVQIQIPADGDIAVAYVEGQWFYNGHYATVDYDWLSAGGYICVQRP